LSRILLPITVFFTSGHASNNRLVQQPGWLSHKS
jgi:hypothetical protein